MICSKSARSLLASMLAWCQWSLPKTVNGQSQPALNHAFRWQMTIRQLQHLQHRPRSWWWQWIAFRSFYFSGHGRGLVYRAQPSAERNQSCDKLILREDNLVNTHKETRLLWSITAIFGQFQCENWIISCYVLRFNNQSRSWVSA